MRILYNKKFTQHNVSSEYEGSYRLSKFEEWKDEEDFNGEPFLSLVHSEKHIKLIKNACLNNEVIAEVELTPESYSSALSAVGLSIMASLQGDFAVVRPPGHHAHVEKAHGFCFFNNIAIATQNLVNKGKKVMIIDIDGHHGDGTQSIFYDSDRVFYASIHQAFTFPFTGSNDERGVDKGEGYTLNIPLMPGSGEDHYLKSLDKIISEGYKFQPDVVAVSAGFDGYSKDRLLSLDYTIKSYYETGFKLKRAFNNIFAILEGGYHEDLKECIDAFISGINVGSRPVKDRFDHNMSIG